MGGLGRAGKKLHNGNPEGSIENRWTMAYKADAGSNWAMFNFRRSLPITLGPEDSRKP